MSFRFFKTGFPKVSFAFLSIIIIVLSNVAFNFFIISKNKATLAKMTDVVNPFMESLQKYNLMVTESKMYATNWVFLVYGIDDKKALDSLYKYRYPKAKNELLVYLDQLNQIAETDSLQDVFRQFEELETIEQNEIMSVLVKMDDYNNATKKLVCESIIEEEVLPRTDKIMRKLSGICKRNEAKIQSMKEDLNKRSKNMMAVMLATSGGLFIFILFTLSFISGAIRKPALKMKDIILQLGRGELPEEKIEVQKNVIGEMAVSVNSLSDSFRHTSIFANEIGKGNLKVHYEKLSENDLLGNALIHMRDSLNDYSEDMEKKVLERTKEVLEKGVKLEQAYKEIKDSINYARRIQESILPSDEMMTSVFPESFIFYRPKDVVCGDFYWFTQIGDDFILCVLDCTGHGVPGALMTVIGNSILNQVVAPNLSTNPSHILERLDKKLLETLKKQNGVLTNDGMDGVVCRYRISTRELTYSGAKRPLFIMREGELTEVKPDKSPVGTFGDIYDKIFTDHTFIMNPKDSIYMFTDGMPDQFGGIYGKKYMIKRFREILLQIGELAMETQAMRIEEEVNKWMGEHEQTDDMLLMGIRF